MFGPHLKLINTKYPENIKYGIRLEVAYCYIMELIKIINDIETYNINVESRDQLNEFTSLPLGPEYAGTL